MSEYDCPFCERIQRGDYDQWHGFYVPTVVSFKPLNPVTPGHMLFVPAGHAEHPSPDDVDAAMYYAARYGGDQREDFNLITSSGEAATQTIAHIHVHYVPRKLDDELSLPWTDQNRDDHE